MMLQRKNFLIFTLTIGIFGILNTEMGIIGVLPLFAERFHVSISEAGMCRRVHDYTIVCTFFTRYRKAFLRIAAQRIKKIHIHGYP